VDAAVTVVAAAADMTAVVVAIAAAGVNTAANR
jgi:hypothetical protein